MYIKFPQEKKEQAMDKLKDYFYTERSEEIGDIAAEGMLDFIMKELGPFFYNQGVHDAKDVVEQKIASLEEDIQALERPISRSER
ncbi:MULTISPECIES: DUF2164 domain-containing protein [unclassified Virgibacillus]|uniref:DUF2164 domain-containing protein n=1 Tax=unclassified Virgibacillus TaxID=2620237 RepID=UPI0024DE309F|nr:DUF2164 domain-containing protein [Virgibacillus sp. LDC-1]